jgi:hypothetical protein
LGAMQKEIAQNMKTCYENKKLQIESKLKTHKDQIKYYNMKKSIGLIFSLLIVITNSNCKRDDNFEFDHSQWNYIKTGDYSEALILEIKDTINTESAYNQKSTVVDINKDAIPDMDFYSYFTWFLGQSKFDQRAEIKTFDNCDIIVDTTIKSIKKRTDYVYTDTTLPISSETIYMDSLIMTPEALGENSLINSESNWYHNQNSLYFSFNTDKVLNTGPPAYIFENYTFEGWKDLSEKCLGFRIILEKDTLYGYIKMNVNGYKCINIEDAVYR